MHEVNMFKQLENFNEQQTVEITITYIDEAITSKLSDLFKTTPALLDFENNNIQPINTYLLRAKYFHMKKTNAENLYRQIKRIDDSLEIQIVNVNQ
jgi:hypothetical protein